MGKTYSLHTEPQETQTWTQMNYLLQRRGGVPAFNPYMNNKHVHIGYAQIF